jgi:hypothetical protein
MLRMIAACVAAVRLAACGDGTVYCGACRSGVSIASLHFSQPPAGPLLAEVCVDGGSCCRLHTTIATGDHQSARCSTNLPPPPAGLIHDCWAQASADGGWQIDLALPDNIDGRTVTARSLTPGPDGFEAHAVGDVEAAEHGPCACPPDTIASIDIG